jgi:hypothetical protein
MLLRGALFGMLFSLVMSLMSYELIGTESWFTGLACGALTAWAYSQSSALARTLGAVGVLLLIAAATGVIPVIKDASGRSFMNGMSFGFVFGWVLIGLATWPRSGSYLMRVAKSSDDEVVVRLLTRLGIKK